MGEIPSNGRRRTRWTLGVAIALASVLAVSASANHSFLDVPDDHVFHGDIAWMLENDITRGCNPPANTQYCPQDDTTRGQMAAFFHRFALSQSVDAGWLEGHTADEFLRKDELDELGGVEGPQGPQGPQGNPGTISADNVTVRTASQSEGNLLVVGNTYTALCESGEVAIGGGYEANFTLVSTAVDDLLGPLAPALNLVGLGALVNLGDTLDGVSNLSVHTDGPAQVGGDWGWEIGTTLNVASDITVRVVCVG